MSRLPNDHQRVIALEELRGRLSDYVLAQGAEYWGWDLIEAVVYIADRKAKERDAALARVAKLEEAARMAKRALSLQIQDDYVCPGCAVTIMDPQDHMDGCTWMVALAALRAALNLGREELI